MRKYIQRSEVVNVGYVRITEKSASQSMYFEVKVYSAGLKCIETVACNGLDEVMSVLTELNNTH